MAALKLGTRGSKLALTQAGLVRDALARSVPALAAPDAIEIVVIKTTGDAIQDRPLSEAGGKGLFVKEIEEAMLARRIDIAVHSMKDMPTAQPAGLLIAAFLAREDARDVLIAGDVKRIADLAQGAVVGTVGAAAARPAPASPARPQDRQPARQCRHQAAQARGRRSRGDHPGAGRLEAARPRTCRRAGARGRDAARRRPGRDLHRMPHRRCADARLARRHRPRSDGDLREGRACDAVRARRLVPHADCRPRGSHRRRDSSSRPDRQARRLAS